MNEYIWAAIVAFLVVSLLSGWISKLINKFAKEAEDTENNNAEGHPSLGGFVGDKAQAVSCLRNAYVSLDWSLRWAQDAYVKGTMDKAEVDKYWDARDAVLKLQREYEVTSEEKNK